MSESDHQEFTRYAQLSGIWVAMVAVGFTVKGHYWLSGMILICVFATLAVVSLALAGLAWRRHRPREPAPSPAPLGYWNFKEQTPGVVLRIGTLGAGIATDMNRFTVRVPYHAERIAAAGDNPSQNRRRLADQAGDIAAMFHGMSQKVEQLEKDCRFAAEGYVAIAVGDPAVTPEEIAKIAADIQGATALRDAIPVTVVALGNVKIAALALRNVHGGYGQSQDMNGALDQSIAIVDRAMAAVRTLGPALDQAIQVWRGKIDGPR